MSINFSWLLQSHFPIILELSNNIQSYYSTLIINFTNSFLNIMNYYGERLTI